MKIRRTLAKLKKKGPYYYAYFGWQWLPFQKFLHGRIRSDGFIFKGKRFQYFYANYNRTWMNERCVEIPIIWDTVLQETGKILEIGNVLSHYFPVNHDVVDKYERARNVINEDIERYRSKDKYALIVSISTLEHVGFDELIPDEHKIVRVFEQLKSMLTPGGKIVATLALGYNPTITTLIESKALAFSEIHCFRRSSGDKSWTETNFDDARDVPFAQGYPGTGAVLIAIYNSPRLHP